MDIKPNDTGTNCNRVAIDKKRTLTDSAEADPQPQPEGWKDETLLRELYWDRGFTLAEVADYFDVSVRTIQYWMGKFDIERRDRNYASRCRPASYTMNVDGYMEWETNNSDRNSTDHVYVHRLLAVAEYGFDAVRGKAVHHLNGISWDNRPENIEALSHSDHARRHTKVDRENQKRIADRYEHSDLSSYEIADEEGVSHMTVLEYHKKYYGGDSA